MLIVVILWGTLARALRPAKRQLNFVLSARVGGVARQDVQRVSCDWRATDNTEIVTIGTAGLCKCWSRAYTRATQSQYFRYTILQRFPMKYFKPKQSQQQSLFLKSNVGSCAEHNRNEPSARVQAKSQKSTP